MINNPASNNDNSQRMAMEQKINELAQQSRTLELYFNEVSSRESAVNKLMEEARMASVSIQNLSEQTTLNSLVPIGGGVYVQTQVPPITKLLINIGADVVIEKNKQGTINFIEERIKEYELASRQLVSQKQQISMRMEQIQHQVNEMLHQSPSD